MSCERVRSFTEAKLSSICCCSPDPQGSLHCHRRKLGWLDVIFSWEIEAGCYLSPGYILGAKRQIAWLFIPRIFWALKSSRFIPNSPDSPSFFFSIFFFSRKMMYLQGDNSFAFLPDRMVQMTEGCSAALECEWMCGSPMGWGRGRADHHTKILWLWFLHCKDNSGESATSWGALLGIVSLWLLQICCWKT